MDCRAPIPSDLRREADPALAAPDTWLPAPPVPGLRTRKRHWVLLGGPLGPKAGDDYVQSEIEGMAAALLRRAGMAECPFERGVAFRRRGPDHLPGRQGPGPAPGGAGNW